MFCVFVVFGERASHIVVFLFLVNVLHMQSCFHSTVVIHCDAVHGLFTLSGPGV